MTSEKILCPTYGASELKAETLAKHSWETLPDDGSCTTASLASPRRIWQRHYVCVHSLRPFDLGCLT